MILSIGNIISGKLVLTIFVTERERITHTRGYIQMPLYSLIGYLTVAVNMLGAKLVRTEYLSCDEYKVKDKLFVSY